MIRINVNGEDLVLNHNTTMTVELNNALLATTDVEGDISFSFSLPVEGNERILDFPHLPQFAVRKSLPCTVYCNDILSWRGRLRIQKVTLNSISAALIINPYPEGFGKRSLTDNEDEEIEISQSLDGHDTSWEQYLTNSIHNPNVKFAPFFNDEGYGNENENWGYWHGRSRRRVVNELFFDESGNRIDSDVFPFSKAHNVQVPIDKVDEIDENTGEAVSIQYTEINQLAFCPQIRIARVMEIWCKNAGYKFINHMGEDLDDTFLQSQRSLDGTAAQYTNSNNFVIKTTASQYVSQGYHYCNSHYLNGQSQDAYVHNGKVWLPNSGNWEVTVDGYYDTALTKYLLADGFSQMGRLFLFIYKGNSSIDDLFNGNADILYKRVFSVNDTHDFHIHLKKYIPSGYTTNVGLRFALCCEAVYYHYQTTQHGPNSTIQDKFYKRQEVETVRMNISFRLLSSDLQQTGFNIFRRKFCIAETLPEVTNAAFLKAMLETMGLCYFISGKTKYVELVPYALLHDAHSIDLSPWELTRETEIQTQEETRQTFRLQPLKDEEYDKRLRLDDIDGNNLPDACTNHEHLVLLSKTNTLYKTVLQEHGEDSWVDAWEEYSGNPDKMEVGYGKEEKHEPGVRIPHQRFAGDSEEDLHLFMSSLLPTTYWANEPGVHSETDTATGEIPQLMVADFTISSDIYNSREKPSEIILTQYRGLRKREYHKSKNSYVWNEVMLPVWNNEFSLTAKGANSLGEKYVRPVLELLGHRTVTYKFRIPASMMQAVEDLLRPSELEPSMQTRFLIVRNVKTAPKKITFQIDNDIDDTVLCQIEAVKVY